MEPRRDLGGTGAVQGNKEAGQAHALRAEEPESGTALAGLPTLPRLGVGRGSFGKARTFVGSEAGSAATRYLHGSLAHTVGAHAQVTAQWGWVIHTLLLPVANFWSFAVTFGELLAGVGLILGTFTGTALLAGRS